MIDYRVESDGEKAKSVFQEVVDRDRLEDLLIYLKAVEEDRDEWKEKAEELESEVKDLRSEQ